MNKIKLIVHERFNGKRSQEDVFLSAFQSESYQLIQDKTLGIIYLIKYATVGIHI